MSDFIVSQEDWSLYNKGHDDQNRHKKKVKEAIKDNLIDFITDESFVVLNNDKSMTKVPLESLNQYKIIYQEKKMQYVGQGDGDSQIGDVVDKDGDSGNGNGVGDQAGKDYFEAEVSLMDVEEALFEELELPNLKQKQAGVMETESYEFNDIRKVGITGNIHKKKTLLSAFKRNALKGKPSFYPVISEDLKYRSWNETKKPDTRAVIFAMMDISGSMGLWEKYMARSIYYWIKRFLETKYEKVEIVYVAHHTEAKLMSEEEFFSRGESGGTICSSAYRKTLQLIEEKYPISQYNIYAFHTSDGDNLTSDNGRCVKLIERLTDICNMFSYIEVNQYNRHSTLMMAYKSIKNEKFKYYIMKQKADVFHALKTFFRKEDINAKN